MASYEDRAGNVRVLVRLKGFPTQSATFPTKKQAKAWAEETERHLRAGRRGSVEIPLHMTVKDMLTEWGEKEMPKRDGKRWDAPRIKKFAQSPLGNKLLKAVGSADVADWRDTRLKEVSADTVARELALLSSIFTWALKERRWLAEHPVKGVTWPKRAPRRTRRVSDAEIAAVCAAVKFDRKTAPQFQYGMVGWAFEFCIETALRAGECVRLRWGDIDIATKTLRVLAEEQGGRKTLAARREVPLTPRALSLLEMLKEATELAEESIRPTAKVAGLTDQYRSKVWSDIVNKLRLEGIDNLHFHDTRHEAITRLSKSIDPRALMRIVGHSDLNELMTYYETTAEEWAKHLHTEAASVSKMADPVDVPPATTKEALVDRLGALDASQLEKLLGLLDKV